ncbi:MAG TPA: phosphohydrolase, partial [Burkholderiales bacterium]|nr:phosphohydrolase [Burkholderiales bacterium]
MAEEFDSQYLKSVTALGDTHRIVTNQDIYSGTGIKLATSGTRIDSSFYDKLVRHKLMPQIDECMTVEDGVTAAELLSRSKKLFEHETWLSRIPELVEIERLWSIPPRINLVNALPFKLTVARESRPALLDHCLRIMLLSLYLGMRQDLQDRELTSLATAAVFHDLGDLHIDPEILAKSHALTLNER